MGVTKKSKQNFITYTHFYLRYNNCKIHLIFLIYTVLLFYKLDDDFVESKNINFTWADQSKTSAFKLNAE